MFPVAKALILWTVVVMTTVSNVGHGYHDDNDDDEAGGLVDERLFGQVEDFLPEARVEAAAIVGRLLASEAKLATDMRRSGRATESRKTFRFVQLFMGSTPTAKHLSIPSLFQSTTLARIKHRFGLSRSQVRHLMDFMPPILRDSSRVSLADEAPRRPGRSQCPYPKRVVCDRQQIYRSYDGRCNNLVHPLWGSSHQPLVRFVDPDYEDGIGRPRVSSRGGRLASARTISATVHWDIDIPHHMHTLMLMQMGQFLDHDMSRTAMSKMTVQPNGLSDELEDFECGEDGCETEGPENHPCFPIRILRNDTDFGHRRKKCLMFVRSQEVPNEQCKPGPREQLNQLTAYLDASHIYGSTEKEALDLREVRPDRGRMRVTPHPAGPYKSMLPIDAKLKMCRGDNRTILCFKAGDGRVNEFSGLTTQHVIWVREHNRLEQSLRRMNRGWDGETLFQETRRIITAMWQFCVYSEFLPIILGGGAMEAHGLTVRREGYWNEYDGEVNAGIANSFATAAMRFGHTQLQGMITGRDTEYRPITNIQLSTQLRRPHLMYAAPHRGMDMMMLALIGQSTQVRDPFITKQVTRHLFSDDPPHALGEDLMSLNMQRGRDHGLPGYNYFREWCGLRKVKSFDELVELPTEVVQRFRILYRDVDDIDLWPAGISESSSPGAFLGPTFTCILARQFKNLKYGDRFWFENNAHNTHPFTPDQLREIRKITYSKVLCTNADSVFIVQPKIFLHPLSHVHENMRRQGIPLETSPEIPYLYGTTNNERVSCDQLPTMNLEPWREQPLPTIPFVIPLEIPQYPLGQSQQLRQVPLGKSKQLPQDSIRKSDEELLEDPLHGKSQLPQDLQSYGTDNAYQEIPALQDQEMVQFPQENYQVPQFSNGVQLPEVQQEQLGQLENLQLPVILHESQLPAAKSPVNLVPPLSHDPHPIASHDSQLPVNSHDPQREASHDSQNHVIPQQPIIPGGLNLHDQRDSSPNLSDQSQQPSTESATMVTDH